MEVKIRKVKDGTTLDVKPHKLAYKKEVPKLDVIKIKDLEDVDKTIKELEGKGFECEIHEKKNTLWVDRIGESKIIWVIEIKDTKELLDFLDANKNATIDSYKCWTLDGMIMMPEITINEDNK